MDPLLLMENIPISHGWESVFLLRNPANTLEWAHSSKQCLRHACMGPLLLLEIASDGHKQSYHHCGTDGHEWALCFIPRKAADSLIWAHCGHK